MKKIYLLYFVLLPLTAFAQVDYHPFLTEGKRWNYEYEHVNFWEDYHATENVSYVIEGDMVIDGKTYKKLYYGTSDEQFSSLDDKVFHRALREEGKKVYMYDEIAGDILLFDFISFIRINCILLTTIIIILDMILSTTQNMISVRSSRNRRGELGTGD